MFLKFHNLPALVLAAASMVGVSGSPPPIVFEGSYLWNEEGRTGDLVVSFVPVSEKTWDVSFFFVYAGNDNHYDGVAWGSLTSGELGGEVSPAGSSNRYVFRGTFEGGVYRGIHSLVVSGGLQETGTLTLKRRPVFTGLADATTRGSGPSRSGSASRPGRTD
jgi:hypothetical protein